MSEPTGTTAEEPQEEPDPQAEKLLEYERTAFRAAESGNFDEAIKVWSDILDDAGKRAFFNEEEGMVEQIAADLADAYLHKGDPDSLAKADRLRQEWDLEFTTEAAGPTS